MAESKAKREAKAALVEEMALNSEDAHNILVMLNKAMQHVPTGGLNETQAMSHIIAKLVTLKKAEIK
jgi:hypothetical protein